MKRLLIANGSFTSLILSSILKDKSSIKDSNYFLGYFKNYSKEKRQELFNFLNLVTPTTKNLNFFDYNNKINFNFLKLFADIGTKELDEIYIPINSSTKKIYKLFKNQFPNSEFIFYEEGLMSYIKPLFDIKLRKIMSKTKNYYLFYDAKLKNLLLKSFPQIEFNTIEQNNILDNIKTIQKHISSFITIDSNIYNQKDTKYALILPQYYHQGNKKKTAEIISMYKENIQLIIDNGYKIIFKDHPKAKLKYSDTLKKLFNSNEFILFEEITSKNLEVFPVEVIANLIKVDMVFSVYSTSLFTFKHIFNTQSFTSYKMLDERMNFWSIYPTFSALITKNIINNLFKTTKNTKKLLYTENKLLKILILVLKLIHKYKE